MIRQTLWKIGLLTLPLLGWPESAQAADYIPPQPPRPRGGPFAFQTFYPTFFPGPFFGYYPGAYQGFWTNGFSLYGPPVATYGPIPGVFGGTDQRIYPSYWGGGFPIVGIGLGTGRSGLSPWTPLRKLPVKPYPADDYPLFAPPPRGTPAEGDAPDGEAAPQPRPVEPATARSNPTDRLTIEVRVPREDAVVIVDGKPPREQGMQRVFRSPPLEGEDAFEYDFVVRWQEDGQEREQVRTVSGKAGQKVVLDFSREAVVAQPPTTLRSK